MFSQSVTCPAMRVAGRSISKPVKISSDGTLPLASTSRSTSKYRRSDHFANSSIFEKSIGVVKQTRLVTSSGCSAAYITDSTPPMQ